MGDAATWIACSPLTVRLPAPNASELSCYGAHGWLSNAGYSATTDNVRNPPFPRRSARPFHLILGDSFYWTAQHSFADDDGKPLSTKVSAAHVRCDQGTSPLTVKEREDPEYTNMST